MRNHRSAQNAHSQLFCVNRRVIFGVRVDEAYVRVRLAFTVCIIPLRVDLIECWQDVCV